MCSDIFHFLTEKKSHIRPEWFYTVTGNVLLFLTGALYSQCDTYFGSLYFECGWNIIKICSGIVELSGCFCMAADLYWCHSTEFT